MKAAIAIAMGAVLLAGCGIKRPLVRPAEIPAYEKRIKEKQDRYKDEPAAQPQV